MFRNSRPHGNVGNGILRTLPRVRPTPRMGEPINSAGDPDPGRCRIAARTRNRGVDKSSANARGTPALREIGLVRITTRNTPRGERGVSGIALRAYGRSAPVGVGRHGGNRRPVRETPNPARSFRTGANIPANDPRGCEAATREGIEPRGPDSARLEGRRALGPDTRHGRPALSTKSQGEVRCSRCEHNCSAYIWERSTASNTSTT